MNFDTQYIITMYIHIYVYTATSKENDSEMYKRKFDLEDETNSSEGANTFDNMP